METRNNFRGRSTVWGRCKAEASKKLATKTAKRKQQVVVRNAISRKPQESDQQA